MGMLKLYFRRGKTSNKMVEIIFCRSPHVQEMISIMVTVALFFLDKAYYCYYYHYPFIIIISFKLPISANYFVKTQ